MQRSSPELALHFLRCGAAKSDTHAIIADPSFDMKGYRLKV